MVKLKELLNERTVRSFKPMDRSKSELKKTFKSFEERVGTKGRLDFMGEVREFFFDVVKHPKFIERAVRVIERLEKDMLKGYSKASTDLDNLLDKAEAQAKKDAKKKK